MERLDLLVAGIGGLVVVAALGGVLVSGPAGGGGFRVGFSEQRIGLPAQQAGFAGDGSQDISVEVGERNLTSLEFTVRVTGAGPRAAPDAVVVTLSGPVGPDESFQATLPGPGAAADQTLRFTRAIANTPPVRTIQASDEAAALAAAGPPATNGTGTWTLTVAITGGLPVHAESHTIVVETFATAYRAVVLPPVANPR